MHDTSGGQSLFQIKNKMILNQLHVLQPAYCNESGHKLTGLNSSHLKEIVQPAV
jgi:hypothetical protein